VAAARQGLALWAKTVNPKIEIIGVQSEAAPAAYRSWEAHQLLEDQMNTWAEGLQTRTAFALPQRILWDHLDDFIWFLTMRSDRQRG
jgi:threonine dehydratase